MSKPIRWGVFGVARIATTKVIPGMQRSEIATVDAIASRSLPRAGGRQPARHRQDTGSCRAASTNPDIDAIYNPLPNHLHLPWTIRAAEAGEHRSCARSLNGLTAGEAATLVAVRDRTGVKVQKTFMVRTHPQWLKAIETCRSGALGELRSFLRYSISSTTIRQTSVTSPLVGAR